MPRDRSSAGSRLPRLRRNFILQQGFEDPGPGSCAARYRALQFQPRVVTLALLAGIATASPGVFGVLAVLLWIGAARPRWNPFEAVYNRLVAPLRQVPPLGPAPPPRRFAQLLAGLFSAAVALLLLTEHATAAAVVEGVFLAAVLALAFGGFCLGSFLYHLLRGRLSFALRTLPWGRSSG